MLTKINKKGVSKIMNILELMNKPREEMTDDEVDFICQAFDKLSANGTDFIEVLKSEKGIENLVDELQKVSDKGVH
jgi:predicted nucleic-acid-binding protein